jgi:hypothetical protein
MRLSHSRPQPKHVKPPDTPEIAKTPVNTGDFYFKTVA